MEPPNEPRSIATRLLLAQNVAWLAALLVVSASPTIWPEVLMHKASLKVPPRVPRSRAELVRWSRRQRVRHCLWYTQGQQSADP